MAHTFEDIICEGIPSEPQDREFCCAYPTRNGSNSMIKGKAACFHPKAGEAGRVIIAVRNIRMPGRHEEIIHSDVPGKSLAKFWMAVRCNAPLRIPDHLSNDRANPCRRKASDLQECVGADALQRIRQGILDHIAMAEKWLDDNKKTRRF